MLDPKQYETLQTVWQKNTWLGLPQGNMQITVLVHMNP